MLWRHGDVLVATTTEMPEEVQLQPHTILAKGEITGHAHRIAEPGAALLFQSVTDNNLYLKIVAAQATLVHEEHKPIVLPRGTYRVWIQREYTPQEIHRVID